MMALLDYKTDKPKAIAKYAKAHGGPGGREEALRQIEELEFRDKKRAAGGAVRPHLLDSALASAAKIRAETLKKAKVNTPEFVNLVSSSNESSQEQKKAKVNTPEIVDLVSSSNESSQEQQDGDGRQKTNEEDDEVEDEKKGDKKHANDAERLEKEAMQVFNETFVVRTAAVEGIACGCPNFDQVCLAPHSCSLYIPLTACRPLPVTRPSPVSHDSIDGCKTLYKEISL